MSNRNLNAGEPVRETARNVEERLASRLSDSMGAVVGSQRADEVDYGQDQTESDYSQSKSIADDWDRPVRNEPMDEAIPDTRVDVGIGYGTGYNINIEPITSGFILKVGCQTIAVEEGSDVAKLIQIYLSGDKTIGDKWMSSEKNVQKFIKEHLQY